MRKRQAPPQLLERVATRRKDSTLSTSILIVSTFASFASGVSCATVAFACMVVQDGAGCAIFSTIAGTLFFVFGTLLRDLQAHNIRNRELD